MKIGEAFYHPLVELPGHIQIHPTAEIHPSVDLGDDTVVWAYAVLLADVVTGAHCSIGAGTQLMRGVRLGDRCRIGAQVHLTNRMQVGDRVFVAPLAVFADDRRPRVNNPNYRGEPPIIEDDVAVGVAAVVCPGVRLGAGCLIGAGAVVTRDVPPGAVVVGNPARLRVRGVSEDVILGLQGL